MPNIGAFKENLKVVAGGSILKLLADVLLINLDKITDFSPNRMYYKNDVVYNYDVTNDKHIIYICISDKVNPGAFNASDWNNYMFSFHKNNVILENKYVAASDGELHISHGIPGFDYQLDNLVVYHNLRGRLMKGPDWNLSSSTTSIDLSFALYKNESLIFEVLKA